MKFAIGPIAVLAVTLNAWCESAIAAPFICKTIEAEADGTAGGATAVARLADTDVKAGFRLTGGGCMTGDRSQLEQSRPDTTRYSYTCNVVGVTNKVSVTAYAVACRSN